MSSEQKNPSPLKDKLIFVVGPRRLQNELILYFLEQKGGATCRADSDAPQSTTLAGTGTNQPHLVLWDCNGRDQEDCMAALESFPRDILSRDYVALFNVRPDLGIEEAALSHGVRGFFYVQDTLALAEATKYTLEKLRPSIWFPTHGANREYVYKEFADKTVLWNLPSKAVCAENRGDRFFYQKEGI